MPEDTSSLAMLQWAYGLDKQPPSLLLTDPNDEECQVEAFVLAGGVKLAEDITAPLRDNPRKRAGTAKMLDVASFIAHVARFQTAESAVFLNPDPNGPHMTAVLDYHDRVNAGGAPLPGTPPKPQWGKHRTHYAFPVSEEWEAWQDAVKSSPMDQRDFAELLEDRIADVLPEPQEGHPEDAKALAVAKALGGRFAGPSELLGLSRGLKITVNQQVNEKINLQSGETTLVFEADHRTEYGGPVTIPSLFRIAIPVFFGEGAYPITVRLRYRITNGRPTWLIDLYRQDMIWKAAIDRAAAAVAEATGLPIFLGSPE